MNTNNIVMWGNTAKQCRLGLFQDSDFAGDLEDSQSTSGGTLCILEVIHLFHLSWMCKKPTSVSHSSTESEIISLDAGLRLDGIPALDLSLETQLRTMMERRNPLFAVIRITRHQSRRVINDLDNVDLVPSNVRFSHQEVLLSVFEDNEAVIKMIIKGRSPTMRHVSRTHRVALGLVVRSNQFGPKNPNQSTSTPTCRHSNQRKFSHVMSGIICCACSISAISVLQCALIRWRNDLNTIQEKNESHQNRDQ